MALHPLSKLAFAAPLAAAALIGCNQPPTDPAVSITPAEAYTTDTLTVTYDGSTDANKNDSISYRVSWAVDGARQDDLTDSDQVVPRETGKGQVWTATVTPWDGKILGNPVSAEVTILNTPPEVVATLTPDAPDTNDKLRVSVDKSDADGDSVSVTYQWLLNGSPQADTADSLPSSRTNKGEVWEVRVIGNDGETESEPAVLSLTIANTPPSVQTARVSEPFPDKTKTLTCIGEGWEDVDDDAEAYDVEWLVNGSSVGTDASLDGATLNRDDVVRCVLTPNDGDDQGEPVTSSEVVVQNTAPAIDTVTISPEEPLKDDVVSAIIEGATDPDGDTVTYTYEWYVNGSLSGETETLPSSRFRKSDRISLEVTPTDGFDSGEIVKSNTVTAGNNAPSIDGLTLDPTTLYTDTEITTEVFTYDPDDDDVTVNYSWKVNGSTITAATETLDGATWFDKGDTVELTVTPTDSEDFGDPLSSSVLTVLNSAPTAASPVLDPEEPDAGEETICKLDEVSTDADGDRITYTFRWEVNGSGVTGATTTTYTGDTLPGSMISDGDIVVCYVRPFDGTDYGIERATAFGTESNPGVDCEDILDQRPDYESGKYWIDPDEDGDPSDAIEVYCDMDSDGGGWTLVYYSDAEYFDGYYVNSTTRSSDAPVELNDQKDIWNIPSDLDHTETLLGCTTQGDANTYTWTWNNKFPYSHWNSTSTSSGYRYNASSSSTGTRVTCYADYYGDSGGSYGFAVAESASCGSCRNIRWGAYHYGSRFSSTGCNNTSTTYGTHSSKWRTKTITYPVCNGSQTSNGKFWIGVR